MSSSTARLLLVVSVAAFTSFLLFGFGASDSPAAQSAVGMFIPTGVPPLGGGTVPTPLVQKTPPSSDGDAWTFHIDAHNPGPTTIPNWAGVIAKVHVLDATEVDVASVTLAPGNVVPFGTGGPFQFGPVAPTPFGPPSANVASVARLFTAIHPNYINSGINLPPSALHPVIDINVNVKGSSGANSDADLTVMLADIHHVPGLAFHLPPRPGSTFQTFVTPGSQIWTWFRSGFAFVTSEIGSIDDLHIFHNQVSQHTQGGQPIPPFPPSNPPIEESNYFLRRPANPETGHWLHIDRTIVWHGLPATTVVHLAGGPGSTIITLFGSYLYANPFGPAIASLGIDHIPEPTAPVLLLGGVASLVCGLRSRRRRLEA